MKRNIQHLTQLILWLCAPVFFAGCASVQNASVQTFSTGVTTAKSQTDVAFQGVTDLTSDSIIDYAAAQPTLVDTNFLPVLDPASIAVWDQVFLALQKYSQNLVLLTSPDLTKSYEDAAVGLATQIKQTGADLKSQNLISSAPPQSAGLSAAFTELGDLLLKAQAQHDVKKVLVQSDPTIATIFTTMADAVGSPTNNLRATVRAHWVERKGKLQLAFLQAKTDADRRAVAVQYATALSGQTTQDLALASLQRSFLALADAHHALASNRNADVVAAVSAVEQELQNTLNLANRFQQVSKPSTTK